MTIDSKNDSGLTGELLSSDRIGGFMAFAYGFQPGTAFPDNPTWV